MTHRGTDTITWDGWGRMTGGTFAGNTVSYGFDAVGRRRARTYTGTTTRYLFTGGDAPTFETTPTGTINSTSVEGPAGDLAHYAGAPVLASAVSYLYYNGHGDLAAEADTSGARTANYNYDAFGAVTPGAPTGVTSERWTGGYDKQTDASTGLLQMGARPYDPTLGRFLAVDPIDGGSANNYDYAGQDPVNRSDLTGEAFIHDPASAGARRLSAEQAQALYDYLRSHPGPTGWAYWGPLLGASVGGAAIIAAPEIVGALLRAAPAVARGAKIVGRAARAGASDGRRIGTGAALKAAAKVSATAADTIRDCLQALLTYPTSRNPASLYPCVKAAMGVRRR